MKKVLLFIICFSFFSLISAQIAKIPIPETVISTKENGSSGVSMISEPNYLFIDNDAIDFNFQLQSRKISKHLSKETILYKEKMNLNKGEKQSIELDEKSFPLKELKVDEHIKTDVNVYRNFSGYDDATSWPNDNDIAISNGGYIMSVCNSNVSIYNQNGASLYSGSLYAFFNNNTNFTGNLYDPKVLYDNVEDRFILVALDGSNSSTSKLIVGFSSTSNPLDGWYYYYYTGSQFINGTWYDYPNIGINNNYLFITGNLFYNSGQPAGSVVLRFNKNDGYNGNNLPITYWRNPLDPNGSIGFAIYPLSYGRSGTYGDGALFISTINTTGNYYQLWTLNNSTNVLTGNIVSCPNYSIGGDATQKNSNYSLSVGDNRVTGGIYLWDQNTSTGYIHFVFTSTYNSSLGSNGIIQAQIKLTSSGFSQSGVAWGNPGTDFSHGNIAYYGNGQSKEVLINAMYCDNSIYSSHLVFNSKDNFSTDGFKQIKAGQNYLTQGASQGLPIRRGDYMGLAIKFNASNPTVWSSGSYAKFNNDEGTWVSEITGAASQNGIENLYKESEIKIRPNPVSEKFTMNFELKKEGRINITIYDINGRNVSRLFEDNLDKGPNMLTFSLNALSPGTYFIKIKNEYSLVGSEKILVD